MKWIVDLVAKLFASRGDGARQDFELLLTKWQLLYEAQGARVTLLEQKQGEILEKLECCLDARNEQERELARVKRQLNEVQRNAKQD